MKKIQCFFFNNLKIRNIIAKIPQKLRARTFSFIFESFNKIKFSFIKKNLKIYKILGNYFIFMILIFLYFIPLKDFCKTAKLLSILLFLLYFRK